MTNREAGKLDEIDFREYIEILWKSRIFLAGVTVIVAIAAVVINVFFLPRVYEARATILVRGSGGGGISPDLANLTQFTGISLGEAGSLKKDLVDLLKSNVLADMVIDDLHLDKKWKQIGNKKKLRERLKGYFKVPYPDTNLVEVLVQGPDPALTADIANACIHSLGGLVIRMGYTQASEKRKFIENQLPEVEKMLREAETKLKEFTALLPNSSAISGNVGAVRKIREVEIQNAVYATLRKELESTKLEEAKEVEPFQWVDRAEIPLEPVRPRKKNNIILATLLGMFGGSVWVITRKKYSVTPL